jgi:hypothetical protein
MAKKIYLETTMFNFYFAPDKPGYRVLKGQVLQIFDLIKAGEYEPYTSVYVVEELDITAGEEKREQMKRLILDYGVTILDKSDEAERLAAMYVMAGAVPSGYPTDAAHIAVAAVNGLDFIVSLNFEHIARPWTIERVRTVNISEGYNSIGIYKPAEVLEL